MLCLSWQRHSRPPPPPPLSKVSENMHLRQPMYPRNGCHSMSQPNNSIHVKALLAVKVVSTLDKV